MDGDRGPHMSAAETKRLVATLERADDATRDDLTAPAIRSRRGALAVLLELLGRGSSGAC